MDSMPPGSQVAPVLMEKPHGKDIGNSFCMGSCFAKQSEAQCAKPYVSVSFLFPFLLGLWVAGRVANGFSWRLLLFISLSRIAGCVVLLRRIFRSCSLLVEGVLVLHCTADVGLPPPTLIWASENFFLPVPSQWDHPVVIVLDIQIVLFY